MSISPYFYCLRKDINCPQGDRVELTDQIASIFIGVEETGQISEVEEIHCVFAEKMLQYKQLANSTKHKAQSTKHKAQSTKHNAQCTMHNAYRMEVNL